VPDIFLSYNREDQARAKVFAEAFEAQGFQVWWDVGLRIGEAYDQVTEKAVKTAKAVMRAIRCARKAQRLHLAIVKQWHE